MSILTLTRLTSATQPRDRRRLIGIAAGVAVAVALILMLIAAFQALSTRNERATWIATYQPHGTAYSSEAPPLAEADVLLMSTIDYYAGDALSVVFLAANEANPLPLPDGSPIPAPGEFVVSPALERIVAAAPANQLSDRWGRQVGTLGPRALEGPDALVAVVGAQPDAIKGGSMFGSTQVVTEFVGFDFASDGYRIIAIVGAVAVLIPMLLLVSIVTELGAAQRAERLTTLRHIGARPQQLAAMASIETGVTSLTGAVLGIGLFWLLVPVAARLNVGNTSFYPADLGVSAPTMIVVAGVTALAATAVAWWRARRSAARPPGYTRELHERSPKLWTVLPLFAGVALGAILANTDTETLGGSLTSVAVVTAFALTAVGLLWSGPLLTAWVARGVSRIARSPAQVIGASRVVHHPRTAFRAVAGLVIAVFIATVFAVASTATAQVAATVEGNGRLPSTVLMTELKSDSPGGADDPPILDQVKQVPGVTGIVVTHLNEEGKLIMTPTDARTIGLPAPASAQYLTPNPKFISTEPADLKPIAISDSSTLVPGTVFVATDGSEGAVDRARTALITAGISASETPLTRAERNDLSSFSLGNQFATLAYTGVLIAAALAAVSLAVSTISATLDRQRVLRLLALIGMPARILRNLLITETLIPVLTVLVLSVGLGYFTAWSLINSLSSRTVTLPSAGYLWALLVCALLMAAAIWAALRQAKRISASAAVRYE